MLGISDSAKTTETTLALDLINCINVLKLGVIMSNQPAQISNGNAKSKASFSVPVNSRVHEVAEVANGRSNTVSAEKTPVLVRHANPEHGNTVLVDWMIGNRCNYACSYCPDALHDGSMPWQDANLMRAMFRKLRDHYCGSMGKRVWLQFTGGEPTMHPSIRNLLRDASEMGHKVSIISNAGRTVRFWETIRDFLDAAILTYHCESVDHTHFLRVAERLVDAMPTHVNVALPPDRFDEVFALAEDIATRLPDLSLSLKPLRVRFGDQLYPYTPEQLARFETRLTKIDREADTVPRTVMVREFSDGSYDVRRANAMIVAEQNKWQGMICSAGIESLRINGAGNITRAVCGSGGRIGRLGENFNLPNSPVRCQMQRCACVADILITKRQLRPPSA